MKENFPKLMICDKPQGQKFQRTPKSTNTNTHNGEYHIQTTEKRKSEEILKVDRKRHDYIVHYIQRKNYNTLLIRNSERQKIMASLKS